MTLARLSAAVVVVSVLAVLAQDRSTRGQAQPEAAGQAEKQVAARPPSTQPAGFTGSSSCRGCHEPFYQKWATSHHGLAMQPFTAELARTELSPQKEPIEIHKVRYRADIENGNARVIESGANGDKTYPIVHVMGGKNVYYFLTPLDRGRLQVLPVAYDVQRKAWLDTTGSAVRHFGDRRDEALDWRERPLTFNTSCYGCHVSQISTNYDLKTDSYHTVWTEPGINCETCHGPGEEHVRLFRGLPPGKKVDDIKLIIARKFSVEQTNATCATCHAKMMVMTTSYRPGDRFFDHYDLVTLEHPDFYPDGRDLGENYTYTSWRMSPCVKSGKLSCMHCHTSSGRYRFTGDEANNACLPCHQDKVENAAAHTHHKADGAGNKCIACHMPMTEFARMHRTDHSMRPPTPATTLAFKSPNACNLCHADQDAAWADKYVRQWRARDYQAPVLWWARLIDAARKNDWARLPDMLAYLAAPDRDEVVANSLVRLLRGCEDDRKWPVLLKLLKDPSPLIRSSTADALSDHLTSEVVSALLAAVTDDYRLVRVRAATVLAGVPVEALAEGDRKALAKATAEFESVMTGRPDDAPSHYNLGNFYMSRHEYDRAIASFETAMRLQPDSILPLVNASLAYNAIGQNDKAESSLRQAIKLDPANAAANLNLGLLLAEMGRLGEAEAALRAAFKADPRSAVAAYNLGVLLAQDHIDEAIDWCRKASELHPAQPRYAYTYAFYLYQRGHAQSAINVLDGLVRPETAYPDAYALLGQIYEEQGRASDAIAVYQQAVAADRLPEPLRDRFAARIQALSPR
jgi:tetratricopeptide (TPR) repeat protein